MIYLSNMSNRLRCALCFLLASRLAMLVEKDGVALLQSTLNDVEHCDWLIDIPLNKSVNLGRVR